MIGITAGAQFSGQVLDRLYQCLSPASSTGKGCPEFRVPPLFVSTALVFGGLFMYGGYAQAHVHWIVPDIGALVFAFGTVMSFTSLQNYRIDSDTTYAASAIGTTATARSITGFGFPPFPPVMYDALGWGWANTVLGCAAVIIGYTGACVLWVYGEALRKKNPFAASTD